MFQGENVRLRAMTVEDAAVAYAFVGDLELYSLDGSTPRPLSLKQLQALFEELMTSDPRNRVAFTIEAGERAIGTCMLRDLDGTHRSSEMGISVWNPEDRGQGYGKESIRLLVEYGFRHLNLHRIGLTVVRHNERAIRCYRSCGFQEEGRLRQSRWIDGEYVDMTLMSILRSDWK
jgi:RimJ/RimL family protein N-acetyltransferase